MARQNPILTDVEWRKIEAVLPRSEAGRQRFDDRPFVTAILLMKATRCSVEQAARVCGINPSTLQSRRRRWKEAGVLAELDGMSAVIRRLAFGWARGFAGDLRPRTPIVARKFPPGPRRSVSA